jgi:hypothetical protein
VRAIRHWTSQVGISLPLAVTVGVEKRAMIVTVSLVADKEFRPPRMVNREEVVCIMRPDKENEVVISNGIAPHLSKMTINPSPAMTARPRRVTERFNDSSTHPSLRVTKKYRFGVAGQ